VATVAGVLLLADFLNVFVTIDRLDPLLVFLRGIFYPFIRVGNMVWKFVKGQRARTIAQLAADGLRIEI